MAIDEDDDDFPSLSGVSREMVRYLRDRGRHLALCQQSDPGDDGVERRMLQLGNTLAKVTESARKLQVDGLAAIEVMSFRERAALFISWYHDLPPPYRAEMRFRMDQLEEALARPVAPGVGREPLPTDVS